ncbi:hypothetical protein [Amycolatopsis minnesotensis]
MHIVIPSRLQVEAELATDFAVEETHNAGIGHPQVRTVLDADDLAAH